MSTDFEGFNPHAAEAVRLKEETERRFVEILLGLQIERTAWVEKFSAWLLLITGAAFPLLLANGQHVITITSVLALRIVLLCLTASGLFGILLKYRMALIFELRDFHRVLMAQVKEMSESEQGRRERIDVESRSIGLEPPDLPMDIRKVFAELRSLLPPIARILPRNRNFQPVPASDLLSPLKRAVRLSWYVRPIFLFQLAAFLGAPLAIALSLSSG